MDDMRHFKFVGGPWDGEYHEVNAEWYQRGYLHVRQPMPFKYIPPEEMDEVPVEYITYTLREFAGSNGPVYYFANSTWSDVYVISQLVHHYPGKP